MAQIVLFTFFFLLFAAGMAAAFVALTGGTNRSPRIRAALDRISSTPPFGRRPSGSSSDRASDN